MNLAHTFVSNLTILRGPLCRLSRSGLPCSDDWLTKIQPWVDQWEQADELLVHPTGPHTDSSFRAYLTWYLPRTRARLVYVDTYPVSRDGTGATDTGLHRLVYVSYFGFYMS